MYIEWFEHIDRGLVGLKLFDFYELAFNINVWSLTICVASVLKLLHHFISMTIDIAGVLSVSSTFYFHDYWCYRCFERFSNISLPWLLMLQVFWAFLQHFTSMTIDVTGVLSVSPTFHFHDYWCYRCFERFFNISLPWLLMLQVFWAFLQHFTSMTIDITGVLSVSSSMWTWRRTSWYRSAVAAIWWRTWSWSDTTTSGGCVHTTHSWLLINKRFSIC